MKYEGTGETREAAHKILAYLMDNPNSQDTLEGIVDWWMLQQDIKRNITLIRMALDELIYKKLLLERESTDKKKYYQLNR